MNEKEHKEKHIKLHSAFDELLADFIAHTEKLPSKASIMELLEWSHEQTTNPTQGRKYGWELCPEEEKCKE